MGVKFRKDRMKVDITLGDEVFRPFVGCGVLFSEWIINKICTFPVLQSLILLIKRLLHKYNLNLSYYGKNSETR
jgi:hypothetical protein